MTDLSGKTAIITGASRGIGEASARHLAKLGAKVILAARSIQALEQIVEEIHSVEGKAEALACDVSDCRAVAALIEHAQNTFGSVDILVNNAGLIEPIARIIDSDPAEWGRIVDVNVKGVYYGLRYAIPVMRTQGAGTIINISSGAANSSLEGWSHYCATKAAISRLTGVAHKEYASDGICVVGLSPGTVATNMQSAIKASGINPVSKLKPSDHIPTKWVAKALAFLCGPDGIKYAGSDFSLKTNDGRKAVGLPLL